MFGTGPLAGAMIYGYVTLPVPGLGNAEEAVVLVAVAPFFFVYTHTSSVRVRSNAMS